MMRSVRRWQNGRGKLLSAFHSRTHWRCGTTCSYPVHLVEILQNPVTGLQDCFRMNRISSEISISRKDTQRDTSRFYPALRRASVHSRDESHTTRRVLDRLRVQAHGASQRSQSDRRPRATGHISRGKTLSPPPPSVVAQSHPKEYLPDLSLRKRATRNSSLLCPQAP